MALSRAEFAAGATPDHVFDWAAEYNTELALMLIAGMAAVRDSRRYVGRCFQPLSSSPRRCG
jgi:hypothetical protein